MLRAPRKATKNILRGNGVTGNIAKILQHSSYKLFLESLLVLVIRAFIGTNILAWVVPGFSGVICNAQAFPIARKPNSLDEV